VNFIVSMAGKAYDAQARALNWEFGARIIFVTGISGGDE
jgi:hypothetical protein